MKYRAIILASMLIAVGLASAVVISHRAGQHHAEGQQLQRHVRNAAIARMDEETVKRTSDKYIQKVRELDRLHITGAERVKRLKQISAAISSEAHSDFKNHGNLETKR